MDREVPQHDRRRLARLAALPMWAAAEFTESEAAVMRIVGVEMLNNRGVCALHIKTIAAAAGVSVSTARGALKTAKEIGLVTVERLMGNYDVRSRTPTWLAALRDLNGRIERFAQRDPQETAGKKAAQR
jgi:hypothetical protein